MPTKYKSQSVQSIRDEIYKKKQRKETDLSYKEERRDILRDRAENIREKDQRIVESVKDGDSEKD